MSKEKIIVSFTSYGSRLKNIPLVLDSIFTQSLLPDKVVLNLAKIDVLPLEIESYCLRNNVEINIVEDTKVYKKILPTLLKYPNDCIVNIDDDWIYPSNYISIEASHAYKIGRFLLKPIYCLKRIFGQ